MYTNEEIEGFISLLTELKKINEESNNKTKIIDIQPTIMNESESENLSIISSSSSSTNSLFSFTRNNSSNNSSNKIV